MRKTFALIAVLAVVTGACSEDGSVQITDAWSRAAVGPNGAVYLTIDGGGADMALVSVSVSRDVAAMAQIHQTVIRDDGTMGMTQLPEVEIPAGSTVMLVPGGVHLMLLDLTEPLEAGDELDVTLIFDDGTERSVAAEVRGE